MLETLLEIKYRLRIRYDVSCSTILHSYQATFNLLSCCKDCLFYQIVKSGNKLQLFLGFIVASENLASLTKHVEIHLRKSGQVIDAQEDDGVVERESHISGVWHFNCEMLLPFDLIQSCNHCDYFSRCTQGVQSDEESVSE